MLAWEREAMVFGGRSGCCGEDVWLCVGFLKWRCMKRIWAAEVREGLGNGCSRPCTWLTGDDGSPEMMELGLGVFEGVEMEKNRNGCCWRKKRRKIIKEVRGLIRII